MPGERLLKAHLDFDICFTSYLKRAIHTLNLVLKTMDREWLPVIKSWKLNERHYGALQGLNKSETAAKYGEEQVKIWRRSFDVPPPLLKPGDDADPRIQPAYRDAPPEQMPLGESLKDTIARTVPYFFEEITPLMQAGQRVLISAHGNSLRALVKEFSSLSEDEIVASISRPAYRWFMLSRPILPRYAKNISAIRRRSPRKWVRLPRRGRLHPQTNNTTGFPSRRLFQSLSAYDTDFMRIRMIRITAQAG